MKFAFLLACILCASGHMLAEEAKSAPQNIPVRMYKAWLGLFTQGKPLERDPENNQLDVSKFLETNGIQLTPGEEAIFDTSLNILMVRAKPETLDLVNSVGFIGCFGGPTLVRMEVILVDFASAKLPEMNGRISFDAIREAAGDSWHVLGRTALPAISGQRQIITCKTGAVAERPATPPLAKDQPQPSDEDGPLGRGEYGTSFEVEPVVGGDARFVDVSLVWRSHGARIEFRSADR